MALTPGRAAFSGSLDATIIRGPRPKPVHMIRLPGNFGRLMFTRDPGDARQTAREYFQSNLSFVQRDGDGRVKDQGDLGSGLLQENFIMGLMQDSVGATSNLSAPIFANAGVGRYMYSGTGVSANTYDYQLGTGASAASAAITPTLAYSADNAVFTWVGTLTYQQSLAITEWGLFNTNLQGAQQNCNGANTWNAQGQASATWNATLGAAANKSAGSVCVIGGSVGLYIISNTTGTAGLVTGAVTPTTAYYALSSGGGAGTQPYTNYNPVAIYPLMMDHKTFSALNVVSSDQIQFTYSLTLDSGG